jgi:hypothetical protein
MRPACVRTLRERLREETSHEHLYLDASGNSLFIFPQTWTCSSILSVQGRAASAPPLTFFTPRPFIGSSTVDSTRGVWYPKADELVATVSNPGQV